MRAFTAGSLCGVVVLVLVSAAAAARAAAAPANLGDLPVSSVTCSDVQPSNSPLGVPVRLRAGITYQASTFPIPIRLAVPDSSWSGGQWKTGSTGCYIREHGGLGRAPFYGWVSVGHGSDARHRRGSIVIMTSYGKSPSVAGVIAVMLRSQRGVTFEQPVPAKVSGLPARRLDGQVDAARHQFFAFTKPGAAAGAHVDGVDMTQGAQFRILVFDAHGRTVVIYIGSGSLQADAYPSFLESAESLLGTLRFPRG